MVIVLSSCQTDDEPEILEQLNTPTGLTIDEYSVTLDEVEHATSYVLDINGELVTVTDLTYVFEGIGTYVIRYKAVADGYRDSTYSDVFTIEVEANYSQLSFVYSIHSTFDLPLIEINGGIYKLYDSEHHLMDENVSYIDANQIYLSSSFMTTLEASDESYNFDLEVNRYIYQISIEIIDTAFPYVYTNQKVELNNQEEITFGFDVFETELTDLYMNTADGYETLSYVLSEDGILTIDTDIIFEVVEKESDKNKFILTYQFEDTENQSVYLGFLIINIES
jgi:hypothetical protein